MIPLLPAQAKILAAVSGGADSMALLLALHQAQFDVVAAHVNHGLRGAESDEDEVFVLQLCAAHGIKADSRRVKLFGSSENEARAGALCGTCKRWRINITAQLSQRATPPMMCWKRFCSIGCAAPASRVWQAFRRAAN